MPDMIGGIAIAAGLLLLVIRLLSSSLSRIGAPPAKSWPLVTGVVLIVVGLLSFII